MQVHKPTATPIVSRNLLYGMHGLQSGERFRIQNEENAPLVTYVGGVISEKSSWLDESPTKITDVENFIEAQIIVDTTPTLIGHFFRFVDYSESSRRYFLYTYIGDGRLLLYSINTILPNFITFVVNAPTPTISLDIDGNSDGFAYTINGGAPTYLTNGDGVLNITANVDNNIKIWSTSVGRDIHFPVGYITSIDVSNLNITSIDVSNEVMLESLRCNTSQLTSLDVTKNYILKHLECMNCALTTLDVSLNNRLTTLHCSNNPLTGLILSKNIKLNHIKCDNTNLTTIQLPTKSVVYLSLNNNQISNLDLLANNHLEYLFCERTALVTLTLPQTETGVSVSCFTTQIGSINAVNMITVIRLYDTILDGVSLDAFFTSILPNNGIIYLSDPAGILPPVSGVGDCNPSIATTKGYTVVGID